jgi:hypothetical protein
MKLSREQMIRGGFLLLCCVVLTVTALILLSKKETFFIDEYSSYGCANHPGSREIPYKDRTAYTPEELKQMAHETYSVSEDERFHFGIAWNNLSKNVHPPVFYAALHLASSLSPNVFSQFQAGIMNILFGLVSLFFFHQTVCGFTRSGLLSGVLTLAWTCTLGLYGNLTFLRDYSAAMCGVTMVTWACFRILRGKRKIRDLVWLALASTFSALCHYYCIIYMFFLCATLCIMLMIRKEWKTVLSIVVTEACAAGIAILIFPSIIKVVFTSHRSTEATRNLFSVDMQDFAKRIGTFGQVINESFFGNLVIIPAVLLVLAIPLCLMFRKKESRKPEGEELITLTGWDVCQLTIPACCFFITISKIAAYTKIRYMYPVVPVMVLAIMALLLFLIRRIPKPGIPATVIAAVMLTVGCISWTTGDLHHLYIGETARMQQMLEPYRGTDAVMIWRGRNAMSTCLAQFDYYNTVTFYHNLKEEKFGSIEQFQDGKDVILILGETQAKDGYVEKLQEAFPGYEATYLGQADAQYKFKNYYFHKVQE